MKETDVARPVVKWLREKGREVYQEVVLGQLASVADIVVEEPDSIWIIEAKTSLSWDLLAQANSRKNWAERISVAVPSRKWKWKTRQYIEYLLRREGIGLIEVGKNGRVHEVLRPEQSGKKALYSAKLRKSLHPAQKDFIEAGTAGGGHWTPFKETCKQALEAVTKNPGLPVKELVDSIQHHYRTDNSARSNLIKWGRKGVIPGVKVRQKGRKVLFYPGSTTPY